MEKIAQIYTVGRGVIQRLIKKYNIKTRSVSDRHRKFNIDENYFDVIDTEEKAYFLGFLYADGHNNIKKHTVNLRIMDEEIIRKLNNLISNDNIIWQYKVGKNICYTLSICSKHMSEILSKYGCGKNKTFNCFFPENIISDNLLNHFMRGYFDGDGSIYNYIIKRNNNKISHAVGFSVIGAYNLINKYLDILVNNCNISKAKLQYKNKNDKRVCSFLYSGRNQIITIYKYLYKDANIFMQRKYEKFQYIINKKDLELSII